MHFSTLHTFSITLFFAQKTPFDRFLYKSFLTPAYLAFGILNFAKQHKAVTCQVSGRYVVLSVFYADFFLYLPQNSDYRQL